MEKVLLSSETIFIKILTKIIPPTNNFILETLKVTGDNFVQRLQIHQERVLLVFHKAQ